MIQTYHLAIHDIESKELTKKKMEHEIFAVQFNVMPNLPLPNSCTSFKNIK